ncbi:MAG: agmatinase [Sphingopyxis sp.]|uniref:agmatinase n=1 Tax=Sphingopyxis sp. TaxID=1908224 RepID=UPI002ABA6B6D|nr:agmatinase [Sphingopyxis sp.]MDZ3831541.1 agmatinase [Sphingopyxis sp.]
MSAIRLFGLPTDINSSFERGAAAGPAAIRAELRSERGNLASELGPEIGTDIAFCDDGDLPLVEDTPRDDAMIRRHVALVHGNGEIPIALGGDHAVSFPLIAATAERFGPLNILHIDAHPDLYDDFGGNPRSHASPFARICEAGHAARLVQVGIRTMNSHCRAQAARFGVEVVPMAAFVPETVPVLDGPLYISIDLDGLDPSAAPGVAHPEPGGLTVRELIAVLHRQRAPIVGADIVEYNPSRDVGGVTAIVGAKLVRELAALIDRNGAAGH